MYKGQQVPRPLNYSLYFVEHYVACMWGAVGGDQGDGHVGCGDIGYLQQYRQLGLHQLSGHGHGQVHIMIPQTTVKNFSQSSKL